jgi:hypothetical protein
MMAQKKAEIVKHAPAAIEKADAMPAYLRIPDGGQAQGTENIERGDMTLPRLGLCQSMSPQRKKTDPKYINGLDEGQFFNSISGTVYGDDLKIVPLLFFKSRVLFGTTVGGAMKCSSPDGVRGIGDPGGVCARCPLSQFGPKGERPPCSNFFNYACLVADESGELKAENLVVLSFKSSGLRMAKDWNALIRLRRADIFAGVYSVTSAEQSNDKGSWHVPVIKPSGWVSKEMHEAAQLAYSAVAEMNQANRLRVDMDDLAPEGEGDVA